MNNTALKKIIQLLNQAVIPFKTYDVRFYEKLAKLIGDARIVLLGEATHGTVEFYEARIALTEHLLREKGFRVIAIEGDWTSVYTINCYCNRVYCR